MEAKAISFIQKRRLINADCLSERLGSLKVLLYVQKLFEIFNDRFDNVYRHV
jgi:hypothetical protein